MKQLPNDSLRLVLAFAVLLETPKARMTFPLAAFHFLNALCHVVAKGNLQGYFSTR